MTAAVDCVVIGAGVVGLAVARALATDGREVIILESESDFGTGVSSRNSEVIHAGLYYPPRSLKALLCVRGKELLYRYASDHGVQHRRCEKLVVATSEAQLADLLTIAGNARTCGVTDLQILSRAEALTLEPALAASGALLSPSSGIIDSHSLMLSLLGEAERYGAALALRSRVAGGRCTGDAITLDVEANGGTELTARLVVNAAGLAAHDVARSLGVTGVPTQLLAKGQYFGLAGACPFSRLIYPLPEPGGLGIHLTLDLGGQAKFGPDVQWIQSIDYQVDENHIDRFAARIKSYWPDLEISRLQPAYAGVRPKLKNSTDFVFQGPAEHGVAGLINLYGIESPGLTAALAIGEHVLAIAASSAAG